MSSEQTNNDKPYTLEKKVLFKLNINMKNDTTDNIVPHATSQINFWLSTINREKHGVIRKIKKGIRVNNSCFCNTLPCVILKTSDYKWCFAGWSQSYNPNRLRVSCLSAPLLWALNPTTAVRQQLLLWSCAVDIAKDYWKRIFKKKKYSKHWLSLKLSCGRKK